MSLLQKRRRAEAKLDDALNETDRVVLSVIKSKENMGIWSRDLTRETKLSAPIVNKSLKNLLGLAAIKEVAHAQFKGRKHYLAAEFEPSNEITGGSWYQNGDLDIDFINELKNTCLKIIRRLKVATADGVHNFFKENRVINIDCNTQQIKEILSSMVYDNMILDVKSTGLGEYHGIPIGTVCYRCHVGDLGQGKIKGAMASIPCGSCPHIRECTPDGIISPSTCVYYDRWLNF